MMQGLFWGTYQTYQICVSSEGCLTWPRQVASIEALAVNDQPITLRNNWFEYLQTGFGIRSTSNSSELQLMDRGRSAVFLDMTDFSSTLQVYSEVDEDASAKLLVQGYDQNGNWIRTLEGSQWIDGEYISIGTTTAASSKIFTAITGVQSQLQMAQFICQKLRQNQSSCLSAITNGMNNSQTIDEVLSQASETHHNTHADLETHLPKNELSEQLSS